MDATSFARFVAKSCIAFLVAGAVTAGPLTGPIDPTQPINEPPTTKPALPGMPTVEPIIIETMLGFMIQTPIIAFNNTGVLNYTAATGSLTVDADPLAILLNNVDPPALIFPGNLGPADMLISINVDSSGNLVGGVPGDDLIITGAVDLTGDFVPDVDGVLLTGEVTEYMGSDSGGTTDFHAFRFNVTGGFLAGPFGSDIGIEMTSEMSTFTGDYTVNFTGESKGNIGPVECTGTIGDFVWLDTDGNGIQDDGEPGIGGVQLILTDQFGNMSTATTFSNGFYQFIDLCAGTYTVAVNPASLPPDVDPTLIGAPGSTDENDSNDPTGTQVTLPFNDSMDQDTDFGYVPQQLSSLGDYVWEDLNMDGIQDGNEPPVEGVMVNLYDCGGNFIDSTTTDALGFYQFTGLAPGCYQVEFILPPGFVFSPMDQTGDTLDSDPDPTTGFTGPVNLGPGENNPDVDAGIFEPLEAELGDRFWEDLNGNGIQDLGEPGIEGVTVNLYDCSGNFLSSTTTGANGDYLFPGLGGGCYVVEFVPPQDCVLTAQDEGVDDGDDSDADPTTGQTTPITLPDGTSDLTWDAGCYYPAGLGDFVWDDLNQDGIQDPGEPGIEGLLVVLLNGDGSPTGLTTTTGPNGEYEFTGLPPGSYIVQFTTAPGYVFTLPNVADDAFDSDANGMGQSDKVILESGDFDPTIDAGMYIPEDPSISIEKSTNGEDADAPTGPFIPNGDPVLWEYVVMNTGNVPLTNVMVTDDQGVVVTCPQDTLTVGESMTCTGNGSATLDQYENLGMVTGNPPLGPPVTSDDPSHYFGANPDIDIEKATNGDDADLPTGPVVAVGSNVNWTYEVTNTGNVTLTDVLVTDDQGVVVTCPLDTLTPGQSMTCMANGIATAGQYENLGSVIGNPPDGAGDPVTDEDPSHYFGGEAAIDIEKATNGEDADTPTGPVVAIGSTVEWTYVVTNTGNVDLTDVTVTDDQGVAVSCLTDTLAVGESTTCTASGIATAGQYANIGSVTGNPPVGDPVDDSDPSHYFGADPAIDIEKATNGEDADTPTGPVVAIGSTVEWTYVVTNTGNVDLTDVTVTDDQGVAVSCLTDTLAVGESTTCTASGIATAGQYANIGSVTGNPPVGDPVDDSDPSHYFGADPAIDIEKATNGEDADTPTGPVVAIGSTVEWTYVVTNTGNVDLTEVTVTDDQGVAVSCLTDTLAVGESTTCTASGIATAGQYANIGSVTGNPPVGDPVDDSDPSHYFGADPAIDIEKATNGEDADTPTGPVVAIGSTVEWTYVVTNTGNVDLTDVTVTDDQGVAVSCLTDTLAVGESTTCTASGIATAGQYANIGSVTGNPPVGDPVDDSDPSHYFGADPAIDIEKATNGEDADTPTGPVVAIGSTVEWTYVVTNTGNVDLTDVTVTDDQGVAVSCLTDTLAVGESTTCTASGIATAGQYANIGSVTGNPPVGDPVDDSDPSHYFGAEPSIDIEKATNGDDADSPTGPFITIGEDVNWTYVVTNTGNIDLFNIVVTDNQGVTVTCPESSLAMGDSFICTAMGIAVEGQYANIGSVVGDAEVGGPVNDSDPSHYFGVRPAIDIEKATNGVDADLPTGPIVMPGSTVEWTYVVTNTGNVDLTDVTVTDNQGVTVTCTENTLAVGESFTCTASGIAIVGQYDNVGTVVGTPPVGPNVNDADPSHYFGADPVIELQKLTNGEDADTPTGPLVAVGSTVTWTYVITNMGNVDLNNVVLNDSVLGLITCDEGPIPALAPGGNFLCSVMGIATAGQYMNLGDVCADDPMGTEVCDDDPSHYLGADPAIDIEKATNGEDADTPTGPVVAIGSTVEWTYVVTNTGNVDLTEVTVTDDQGVAVSCLTDTLAVGESTTCTASGIATAGQYANIGSVTGNPPVGDPVDDSDPSHYFGAEPSIDIEKATNGDDADSPTGPFITIGEDVNWTYVVTNTGNIDLFNIVVTDNQGVTVTCPESSLAMGDSFICTAMGIAVEGQYANIGSVVGDAEVGGPVNDSDPSHYFGVRPAIDIEKATNGVDADLPTGPIVMPGSTVEWTYVVTNTGNVDLTDVTVTDNQGVTVTCTENTLAVGESFTCTASGIAIVGQYDNVGTVVGTPPVGPNVNDADPSHYFGADPVIELQKLTNGEDADTPTGPLVAVGSTVTWTYVITNMGNVDLNNVVLNDSVLGLITCDEGPIPALAPGGNFLCSVMGIATAGQYMNLGDVCADDPMGTEVCDDDPSHYLGADPAIDIEKATNGFDADDPTGPFIEVGGAVTWTYVVTNTGNVPLVNVTVTDDQGVAVSCPQDTLGIGEVIECTATGTAIAGQYANIGDVIGTPPVGAPVTDRDPSHYFGVIPGIDIEKATNGIDADDPNAGDAPQILPGDTVTWTYVVTNTGNVPLSGIAVSDDRGVTVVCPSDTLAPGASFMCTATGTADDLATSTETVPGMCGTRSNSPLYENTGSVSGTTPLGNTVVDNDLSHYCNPEVCALEVNKTCLIPVAPASNFMCDKPIDSLTMIYTGTQPIRVKAWKGDVGSTLLADIDDIQPGEEITVMGYAGSPNDVFWEVFLAGTDSKIGESNFHLSCSDDNMDGPEDCGLPQGDGKDDDSSLLNIWQLEGMVDASGTLDCTPAATTGNNECEFQTFPASCETSNADFLTFQYTGGGCGASDNSQNDHICTGSVNGGASATFTDDDGNSVTLNPGDTVTIPRNLAKAMTLSNAGGTETNVMHTSCSQPIVAGDVYGSLTLVQIDGMGVGTDVVYTYEITNTSNIDIVSLLAIDSELGPIPNAPSSLAAGQTVMLNASAFLTETTVNTAIIDGLTADGQMCNDTDTATVTILPPPPCDIDGEGVLDISSDKIKWNLTNSGASTATIESVEISWPNANGDLIEVKFDGDKIWEGARSAPSTTFNSGDWINDLNKRQIPPGDTDTLEIKFGNDVVGPASDYQITVNFDEGCSVTFENTGLPFECNTDISSLSMTWDGNADPIRVKAWYGSPDSSQLLLDQSGVTAGQTVTVSGYEGSGNDVYWEVFSGGTKLGESNFHMSCSDSNMNGAEDCGKRQGDGKSDDSGLLNDWLLQGMVDADGPFDCSNLP